MINSSNYLDTRVNRPPRPITQKPAGKTPEGSKDFRSVLDSELKKPVKISGHAASRMKREGIELDKSQADRLGQAVNKVEDQGGKTSLVLMDDMAMVVNVMNRTLITVVSDQRRADGVFTDIDSAVIAD